MKLILTLLVLFLTFSGTASAATWYGNFDTDDASQWTDLQVGQPNGNFDVNGTLSGHPTAGRFTVHDGDVINGGERVEVYRGGANTINPGDHQVITINTYFPSGYWDDGYPDWSIWSQWHGTDDLCTPPVQIKVNQDGKQEVVVSHVTDFTPCTYSAPNRFTLAAMKVDTWEQWVFTIDWSATAGHLKLTRGNLGGSASTVIDANVDTMYAGYDNYFKQGIYRHNETWDTRVWTDGTKVVTN